jgi:hypothetical protein
MFKRPLIVALAAGVASALAGCGAPVESAPTISLSTLPIRNAVVVETTVPVAPVAPAIATETAVRQTVPEIEQPAPTTTLPPLVPGPENNWGFPYPVMHRDFDPHWDCSQFDALNEKYGMLPLSRAHHVMGRESGCIPGVWNWHVTGPNFNDESYGLYQINMRGSLGPDRRERCGLPEPTLIDGRLVDLALFDPETNIRCASLLDPSDRWDPWGY